MVCARLPTDRRIGSFFGERPGRRSGETTFHAGLDFVAERGDPVRSAARGIVETLVHDDGSVDTIIPKVVGRGRAFRGYGNVAVIRHPELGVWTSYSHLDRFADLQPGDLVDAGEVIGAAGNTTNGKFPGMGVHVHFEVRHANPNVELVFGEDPTPFPGPYARWNLDPLEWLMALGFARPSRRVLEPDPDAEAPGCPSAAELGALFPTTFPLLPVQGPIDWIAAVADEFRPEDAEYEPPAEHFRPGLAGAGIGAALIVGASLWDRARR